MLKILFVSVIIFLFLFLPQKISELEVQEKKEVTVEEKKLFEINEPTDVPEIETVEKEEETSQGSQSNEWWRYPEEILTTTRSGDDLLVLVNKQYKLPSTYAPTDLVKASNAGIRRGDSYYLRNIVINDLKDMILAAQSSGIDLSIVSGYRSYSTQVSTYSYWLTKNNNDVEYVDTFSARPGHSQHQLGTVIDFSSNEINDALGDSFANTNASKWLKENSYRYGFVISYPQGYESITGYKYESWHYRYIGKEYATQMVNNGMILENYLRSKN